MKNPKRLSFVIQLKKYGKNMALAVSTPKNQNLYHYFDDFNRDGAQVTVVHLCGSWKEALALEEEWNNGFSLNGTIWKGE